LPTTTKKTAIPLPFIAGTPRIPRTSA
jgi:hypothetical protein